MAFNPQNTNGQGTMATSAPVVIASNQSAVPVSLASDADNTSTGALALAAQTVVLTMGGKSAGSVSITGTWVGTITFEGTVDGTTWNSINAVAASTSQPQPTTTVNGLYRLSPAGLLQIRANMTAFTSGSASISMRASTGTGGVFVNQILPTKITDGTNTATIKPASTASVATDLPVVVALHPSSPTPNFLAAQAVTGTFFQATQPVSMVTAPTTPVTGTFFQATQPVSATTLPLPTGASTEATLAALNTKTTAVNTGAVTISSALPAGANSIGTIVLTAETTKVIGTVNISAAQTIGTVTTVGAVTAITNALPTGANVIGALTANQSVNMAQIGATAVVNGGVAGTLAIGGVTASGVAATGNPVRTGLVGKTVNPTAVVDGQVANAISDKLGRQVIVIGQVRDLKANQITTLTSSVVETTIVTAIAATFNDVYGMIVTNSSAVATNVAFRDVAVGAVQFNIFVPAGETRGFMLPSSDGFKQTAVNTAWTATCGTSVASVTISVLYVKNI